MCMNTVSAVSALSALRLYEKRYSILSITPLSGLTAHLARTITHTWAHHSPCPQPHAVVLLMARAHPRLPARPATRRAFIMALASQEQRLLARWLEQEVQREGPRTRRWAWQRADQWLRRA